MNSNNTASRGLPTPLRVVIRNFSNAESKWVLLAYVDHHGNIVMEGYDVGPTVEEVWGDCDYEYWVAVGKENKAKLAEALGVGLVNTSLLSRAEFMKLTGLEKKHCTGVAQGWENPDVQAANEIQLLQG